MDGWASAKVPVYDLELKTANLTVNSTTNKVTNVTSWSVKIYGLATIEEHTFEADARFGNINGHVYADVDIFKLTFLKLHYDNSFDV